MLPFHMRQIVVQGLPWAYMSEELSGLFDEYKPASAEVVFGRDGRSRVRPHPVAAILAASLAAMPFVKVPVCMATFSSRSRSSAVARSAAQLSARNALSIPHLLFLAYDPDSRMICNIRMFRVQGYGTVRFETPEAAQAAITAFHQTDLAGRTLAVRLDRYA